MLRNWLRRAAGLLPRVARFLRALARWLPAAILPACTLLDEPFEPQLVGGAADAGGLEEAEVPSPAPSESVAGGGCATEGAEGPISNGGDPTCASAIGLIEPEPLAQSGVDAGAAQLASLSLPPCEGEFGEFGAPERITGLGFDENVFGPMLSSDGRTLYLSAYVSGEQQIYSATRSERGADFSDVNILPVINSPRLDGSPFVNGDERRLYFFSEREGSAGGRDIWVSGRLRGVFQEPEPLAGVNSPASELLPWLSADELTVFFVSGRPGGRGSADLWQATRGAVDEAFDDPVLLFDLSSNENEGRAVMSADGLTAFLSSDRVGTRGGPDLWMASRPSTNQPFSPAQNLWSLNSGGNEQDVVLSTDETELFFASTRRGGPSELFRAERRCL